MHVFKTMTFGAAYELGKTDIVFKSIRRGAIHVRPAKDVKFLPGVPESYEHIPNAGHAHDWASDLRGDRDVFLVGGKDSWIVEAEGPEVTQELVELLKEGISWAGNATLKNPLTQNAIGKHVLLTGGTAKKVISWVPRVRNPLQFSRRRTKCVRTCSCR
jgi:hypothetical protein